MLYIPKQKISIINTKHTTMLRTKVKEDDEVYRNFNWLSNNVILEIVHSFVNKMKINQKYVVHCFHNNTPVYILGAFTKDKKDKSKFNFVVISTLKSSCSYLPFKGIVVAARFCYDTNDLKVFEAIALKELAEKKHKIKIQKMMENLKKTVDKRVQFEKAIINRERKEKNRILHKLKFETARWNKQLKAAKRVLADIEAPIIKRDSKITKAIKHKALLEKHKLNAIPKQEKRYNKYLINKEKRDTRNKSISHLLREDAEYQQLTKDCQSYFSKPHDNEKADEHEIIYNRINEIEDNYFEMIKPAKTIKSCVPSFINDIVYRVRKQMNTELKL